MKKRMLEIGLLFIASILLVAYSNSYAQKIRYINSQTILDKFPEAQEAQKQLDEIRSGYEAEYTQKVAEFEQLGKEIESQSLLLSPEKKSEKDS